MISELELDRDFSMDTIASLELDKVWKDWI